MRDGTLRGKKLHAYIIMKILKYCTDSPSRSFQIKFAVEEALKNENIDDIEKLGPAIKRIMHHKTVRCKFSSVHPDLAAEGITRVEVGEEGLHFITEGRKGELPSIAFRMTSSFVISDVKGEEFRPEMEEMELD